MDLKVLAIESRPAASEEELDIEKGKYYDVMEVSGDKFKIKNEAGKLGWVPLTSLMVLQSSKDLEDEKICGFCNKKIEENFVSTETEVYHVECFYCTYCKESLAGKAFVQKEDSFQCESCYKNMNAKKCAHCKEGIAGQYLTALGKDWHLDHFVCCVCSKPNTNTYRAYKEQPYCDDCYLKEVISKCSSCNKMISMNEKMVEVGSIKLHERCFVCGFGREPMNSGEPIKTKNGKVYCEQHYIDHIATRCEICKKVIQGSSVSTLDKNFHEECFNCQKCGKSFSTTSSHFYKDLFLCKDDIELLKKEEKNKLKEEEDKKLLEEQKKKEEEEKQKLLGEQKQKEEDEKKRKEEEENKLFEEQKKKEEEEKQKLLEEQKQKEEEEKQKLLEEQKQKEEEKKLLEEKKKKAGQKNSKSHDGSEKYYSYEELKNCEQLPKTVNKNRKEEYLDPEEFGKVFETTLGEFKTLPLWKQLINKRTVGLS